MMSSACMPNVSAEAILPARCMSHMRSSTARASSICRYIALTSSSVRPSSACFGCVAVSLATVVMLPLHVDRCAVDRQRGFRQDFGQGGMCVHVHGHLGGGALDELREGGLGDEVARVR